MANWLCANGWAILVFIKQALELTSIKGIKISWRQYMPYYFTGHDESINDDLNSGDDVKIDCVTLMMTLTFAYRYNE